MQLIRRQTRIGFMSQRRLAIILSVSMLVLSVGALTLRGLNLGVDFTGGTLIELGYSQPADLAQIRAILAEQNPGDFSVQQFGTPQDILIRLAGGYEGNTTDLSNQVYTSLINAAEAPVTLRRVEFVGPQVGDELTEDGALAVLIALIAIMIYVALRFEWRFALGSVLALTHDVLITLGLFALLGLEFNLPVLAAILAVIGYSLNDTIVVFDRVRENFRKLRKGTPLEIINLSLNHTLSRTLMTSLTTLLVLLALFFLGGEIIHGFAFALLVGVLIGTYSSIYVASTTLLVLGVSKADLMPVEKEGVVEDNRP